jgi:hypothetical protein
MIMAERPYTETVRKIRDDKLQIQFGDAVRDDFARLHNMLKDKEGFDWDALRHMEEFSKPKGKRDIPIAFAATIEVFRQVTEFAQATKNPALLDELDRLQSDLSGLGADKTPIKVVSVTPHR